MRNNPSSPSPVDIILVLLLLAIIAAWVVTMATSRHAEACSTVKIGGAIAVATVCQ